MQIISIRTATSDGGDRIGRGRNIPPMLSLERERESNPSQFTWLLKVILLWWDATVGGHTISLSCPRNTHGWWAYRYRLPGGWSSLLGEVDNTSHGQLLVNRARSVYLLTPSVRSHGYFCSTISLCMRNFSFCTFMFAYLRLRFIDFQ